MDSKLQSTVCVNLNLIAEERIYVSSWREEQFDEDGEETSIIAISCKLQVYGVNTEDNNHARRACPFTNVLEHRGSAVKETVGMEGRPVWKSGSCDWLARAGEQFDSRTSTSHLQDCPISSNRPFQFLPPPFSLPPVFHNGLSAPSVQLQPGSAEPCCLEGRSAREAWLCFSGRLAVHHPVDDSLQRIHGTKEN
jgi:hypothetical protein